MAVISPEVVRAYQSFIASNPDRKPRTEAERAALFQEIQSRIQGSSQTLSPSLPALQTQQAVREFQVRRNTPTLIVSHIGDMGVVPPSSSITRQYGSRLENYSPTAEIIKSPSGFKSSQNYPLEEVVEMSPGIRPQAWETPEPQRQFLERIGPMTRMALSDEYGAIQPANRNELGTIANIRATRMGKGGVAMLPPNIRDAGVADRVLNEVLAPQLPEGYGPGQSYVRDGRAFVTWKRQPSGGDVADRILPADPVQDPGAIFPKMIGTMREADLPGTRQWLQDYATVYTRSDLKNRRQELTNELQEVTRPGAPVDNLKRLNIQGQLGRINNALKGVAAEEAKSVQSALQRMGDRTVFASADDREFGTRYPVAISKYDDALPEITFPSNPRNLESISEVVSDVDDIMTGRSGGYGWRTGAAGEAPYMKTGHGQNKQYIEGVRSGEYVGDTGWVNSRNWEDKPITHLDFGDDRVGSGITPAIGSVPQRLINSRLPRVTEYVRESYPTTTPATLAFNLPPESAPRIDPTRRTELMTDARQAAHYYGEALNLMKQQHDPQTYAFTGDINTLNRAEQAGAAAMDHGILSARELRGQTFNPVTELQPLAQRLNMQGEGFERNPRALTESLSYKIATDVSDGRSYGMLEPVESLTEAITPQESLRSVANQANQRNLGQQAAEMGRPFTATNDLMNDPRVAALREKAIARQQEIDAGNELMAVRQQRIAERTGPARVAQSPLPQRQVVVEHPVNDRFARLMASQGSNPELADVLERASRGVVLGETGREIPQMIRRRLR